MAPPRLVVVVAAFLGGCGHAVVELFLRPLVYQAVFFVDIP